MIDLLLGQFAPYLILLGGLVVAFFGIRSKVQSSTIKKREEAIKVHQVNEAQLVQAVESQKKTLEVVEKSNEILNNPVRFDDAVARLRAGAKARRDDRNKQL